MGAIGSTPAIVSYAQQPVAIPHTPQQVGNSVATAVTPSFDTISKREKLLLDGMQTLLSHPDQFASDIKARMEGADERLQELFLQSVLMEPPKVEERTTMQKVTDYIWSYVPFVDHSKERSGFTLEKHERVISFTAELLQRQNEEIVAHQKALRQLGVTSKTEAETPHVHALNEAVGIGVHVVGREGEARGEISLLTENYRAQCALLKHKVALQQKALQEIRLAEVGDLTTEEAFEKFRLDPEENDRDFHEFLKEMDGLNKEYQQMTAALDSRLSSLEEVGRQVVDPFSKGVLDAVLSIFSTETPTVDENLENARRMFTLFYGLSTEKGDTLMKLHQAAEELAAYSQDPANRCMMLERALNNFIHASEDLGRVPGWQNEASRIRQEKMVDIVKRGVPDDALQEEPIGGLPPHIKEACSILQQLPKAVALLASDTGTEAFKPIHQMGYIMERLGMPASCTPAVLKVGLKLVQELGTVEHASTQEPLFSTEELEQVRNLVRFADRAYANEEDFVRALKNLETGKLTIDKGDKHLFIHLVKRITSRLQLFFDKLHQSGDWSERCVRLIAALGAPTVIALLIVVSATLAITGVGLPVAAVLGVLAFIYAVSELIGGFLGMEPISAKLGHALDDYYVETNRRAQQRFYERELGRLVDLYMKQNEALLSAQVERLTLVVADKISNGDYDVQIQATGGGPNINLAKERAELLEHKRMEIEATVKTEAIRRFLTEAAKQPEEDKSLYPAAYHVKKLADLGCSQSDLLKIYATRQTELESDDPALLYALSASGDDRDQGAYARSLEAVRRHHYIDPKIFAEWREAIIRGRTTNDINS